MKKKLAFLMTVMLISASSAYSSIFDTKEQKLESAHPTMDKSLPTKTSQLNPCQKSKYTPITAERISETSKYTSEVNTTNTQSAQQISNIDGKLTVIDTQNEIKNELQKLSMMLNNLDSSLKQEIKKIDSKIEILKNQTKVAGATANLPVNETQKIDEKPFKLNNEMQKTFSNSSTRDLKDIPEKKDNK